MNRHVNNTAANIIANTIAVCFVLSAVFVLSCEMPTDGNFGGNIRGTSAADAALAAPKNVRAAEDGESGTITITWDEVPEADGYNVYRSKGASSQVSLRGGVSRTSYPDSGKSVAPDTPYYYFVSAYQGEAESAMTPSGAIELSGGASGILAAPDITGAGLSAGSDNSIRLAWTAVPDAAEYRIYRSSNYDDKQYIFKHKNTEANYLDTGLMPGEYTYQVSAVGADGQEGYLSRTSDWVEVEAGGDMPDVPPAPQNVSARLGESLSIILSWQAVTGATKYYVMRSEDGETYTEIGFAEGETGYTNGPKDASPVSRGGIYYYRVKPYNGNQEGYLSRACGPVVVVPAKPVVTGVSGAANNFTLSWTLEGSADGFRLYRSANNVQYELLKTAAGNERAYTDLTAGVGTYYYRITAYNSGGPGPESDVKKVDVTEFIPVSGISGVPGATQPGTPLELQGAVEPPGATYKDIVWTVKDAGGTGAVISGGALTAAAGTVTVTATIAGGLAPDSP
ncbi:MAG: hypothetical protein LBK05_00545, partial [Treponema sp.]|nr:hypothetical protein [Treponema sp.]